jgi:hypothetical protein
MNKTCDLEGCNRALVARGLCTAHYQQDRKGLPLTPIRRMLDATARNELGQKFCPKCDVWKCVDDFGLSAARKDGRSGICKTCAVKEAQKRYVPKPRKQRATQCGFEGCDKPVTSTIHCSGHHQQLRMGKPLTPLRRKARSDVRDASGRKRCSGCDAWLDESSFHRDSQMRDGLAPVCRECESINGALRKFNITRAQYDELLTEQGGTCAICFGQSRNGDRLSVDHDHNCCPERGRSCGSCIRGLLCSDCNRAIGMMRDDPERLRKAATYLE